MANQIVIISNESISKHNGNSFCDNIAEKSIPEGLSKTFKI